MPPHTEPLSNMGRENQGMVSEPGTTHRGKRAGSRGWGERVRKPGTTLSGKQSSGGMLSQEGVSNNY